MQHQTAFNFSQKVAFITGGATGIGRSTALAFGRANAIVVVVDTNIEEGNHTAKKIAEHGSKSHFIKCDVSKAAEVEAAVQETVKLFGSLDCAFNNAGVEGEQG